MFHGREKRETFPDPALTIFARLTPPPLPGSTGGGSTGGWCGWCDITRVI